MLFIWSAIRNRTKRFDILSPIKNVFISCLLFLNVKFLLLFFWFEFIFYNIFTTHHTAHGCFATIAQTLNDSTLCASNSISLTIRCFLFAFCMCCMYYLLSICFLLHVWIYIIIFYLFIIFFCFLCISISCVLFFLLIFISFALLCRILEAFCLCILWAGNRTRDMWPSNIYVTNSYEVCVYHSTWISN